jgi:proton glutamate symport protein
MLKLLVDKTRTLGYILIFFLAILLALISANYMAVNAIPFEGVVLAKILFFVAFALYATARQSLTFWILFALCLGVEFGVDFPVISKELKRFSDVFLRLIKTIVAPLIFGTLVVGIAGHSNLKQVGRMGLKAIIYFEIVTTLALFIGLAAINFSKAGVGAQIKTEQTQVDKGEKILSQKKDHDPIVDSFPENIAKSVAEGQVLQIVVFSILFAIGMSLAEDKHRLKMLSFAESLSEVMFKFTHVVMYLAPFAVFGAMAYSIATMGTGMLTNLFKLLATLYIALIAFVVLVFIPIGFIIKLNFKKFIQAISEPVSIAFATASSEAALPKALQNMERYGVSRKVVSFVLPTGYSFNLDGTTLYLSLASVFVAQVCGMDLSIGQQISICLVLMLTSKGVAGVRGASFLILVTTLDSQGIDSSKAFAILGIDALMDMARTSVNVVGNCLATVAVAKWEGEVVESIE